MSIHPSCCASSARLALVFLAWLLIGSCAGKDDDTASASAAVVPLISDVHVTNITGASEVIVTTLFPRRSGVLLAFDQASRSVIEIATFAAEFTPAGRLIGATGFDSVRLGPFDELEEGLHRGDVLAADRETGLILRLANDGTARQHATPFQITSATGRSDFHLVLPRALLLDLVLAQDLVSGHLLGFDATGAARIAVERQVVAAAAGVDPVSAIVAGWTRGSDSRDQFARFIATRTIVRVERDLTISRYVDGGAIDALFPGITHPGTLDLVADTSSDDLYVLVADGFFADGFLSGTGRGVAIARVRSGGSVEVFASPAELRALLGDGYDLSVLVVLSDGRLFAVDPGGARVISFAADGTPSIAASKEELQQAAQSDAIVLTVATRLRDEGLVVFEAVSDRHILVR